MSKHILSFLCCLTATISPVFTAEIPRKYSSYESSNSISNSYTTQTTKSSSATTSPPTLSTSLPSSYTLVTTAKPTDAAWSVSYSDYSSLATSSSLAASAASPSGVRFHPDGASPGFYCEYPTLSEWQPCNNADSRDCWLRKPKKQKIKERCNCTDDDADEINIHTDCECKSSTQLRASY